MLTSRIAVPLWTSCVLGAVAHAQAPATVREHEPPAPARSAPVPVEVMVGNAYSSAVLVLSKSFAPRSRWGVFHENTLRAFYDETEDGDVTAQALNAFVAQQHIRSYQWTRVGVDVRGTQFGLAANFDAAGPNPRVDASAGIFVRREVF